jgi:hypothetical protein
MAQKRHEGQSWPAPLAGRLPGDASAAEVADTIAEVWRGIDESLCPIIGHRGVAALYNRSLTITAAVHPWLPLNPAGALGAIDPATLRAALTRQQATEAAAAGAALFQAFRDLLASLIGASLTDRLLQSTWTPASGTQPAQDTAP